MAFTTDPIFVFKEICDLPPSIIPESANYKIKRVVQGEEANCSSSTKFFLIATNDPISFEELEDLRQELRKRVKLYKCPPTTPDGQSE